MAQKGAFQSGSSNPTPAGRKKRRWLRRLLIAAGILLLVVILLPVVLRLYLSDDRIRSMAQEKLSEVLGRKVTVGDFRMAMLSSIEIKDLQVEDKAEYGGNMMTLENLRVAYKAFSVLGDTIEIPEIHVQGLDLHVVKTADGQMNVTDLPPSPPSPPEKPKPEKPAEPLAIPNFRIGKITVSKVGLAYEDKAANRTLSLQGFGLNATSSAKDNILNLDLSGRLEKIVSQTASAPPRTAPPVQAEMALKLDANRNAFEFSKAQLTGEGITASLTGKGSFTPDKIGMDLEGSASVDFAGATLTALSGLEGQTGTINLQLTSSGFLPQLSANLKLDGKDLAWPVDTGEGQPSMFRVASLTSEHILTGKQDQAFALRGTAALRDAGITGKGQKIDAIDMLYDLDADLEEQSAQLNRMELKGPGLDLLASGKVGPEQDGARTLDLTSALKIDLSRAVEPLVPSVKQCQGLITLNATASGTSRAPVMDLALSAPSLQLTQTESGTTYRIEGLEATEKSTLADDQIHVPVEGSFRIARFDMIPPDGQPQSFHDLATSHRLVLDTSQYNVDLESFDLSLPGLKATARGSVKNALSDNPQVDLTKQVSMDLNQIAAWAAPAQHGLLDGVLQVDASVSGSKKSPEVSIQAKSDRLAYRAEESGVPVQLETSLDAKVNLSGNIEENVRLAADVKGLPRFIDSTGKEIDKADLTAVLRAGFSVPANRLEVETASVNAFGLNTSAKGTVDAAGETPVVNANADGELDLGAIAPLLRAVMALSPEECQAAGKAVFAIALAGDGDKQRAELKATADRLQLKYSPEEKEAEPEEEPAPEAEKEGPVPEAMDLTGKSALVTARVNTLVLNGVPISNLVCEIQSEGNQVEIKTVHGEMAGGTLDLSATANTGVPGWDFKIKGGAQHVGLSSLMSLYDVSQADTVRGMASMNLELAGQGLDLDSLSKHLQGGGNVSMATVELSPKHWLVGALQVTGLAEFDKPVQFDAFDTKLTVQNGAVMTEGLALNTAAYGATFLGGIGLDGTFRDASLNLRLPPDMVSRLNIPGLDAGKLNLPEDEHYNLEISLSGSVDDPKKKADWGSLTAQLTRTGITGLIEEKIGEEGGKAVKDLLDGLLRKKE